MPPRYAYWTILAGGLPTAFRAAERDELMPTFRRIKERQPDAEMKYFARGKLWASEEEMRSAERRGPGEPGPGGAADPRRGRDWRPGGAHRDPRQKFKDAKKASNQDRRQERWDRKNPVERPKPQGERPAPRTDNRSGPPPRTDSRGGPPRTDSRSGPPRTDSRGGPPRFDTRGGPPRSDSRGGPPRSDSGGSPFASRRVGPPRGPWQERPAPDNRHAQDRAAKPNASKPFPRDRPRGPRKDEPRGNFKPGTGGDRRGPAGPPRDFRPSSGRRFERNQETPGRPPGPDREPGPSRNPKTEPPPARNPKPEPPPRPSEPEIRPPGPPERGRPQHPARKPFKRRREE